MLTWLFYVNKFRTADTRHRLKQTGIALSKVYRDVALFF